MEECEGLCNWDPQGKKRESQDEVIFEEIMAENFSEFMRHESTPIHSVTNLQKTQDKEIFQATREKKQIGYKRKWHLD